MRRRAVIATGLGIICLTVNFLYGLVVHQRGMEEHSMLIVAHVALGYLGWSLCSVRSRPVFAAGFGMFGLAEEGRW